jgi:hypothetical protein
VPNRRKRIKSSTDWSSDQDCLLIEKANFSMDDLLEMLPYSEDEINSRKRELGILNNLPLIEKK